MKKTKIDALFSVGHPIYKFSKHQVYTIEMEQVSKGAGKPDPTL
jgi:hypothetical protein